MHEIVKTVISQQSQTLVRNDELFLSYEQPDLYIRDQAIILDTMNVDLSSVIEMVVQSSLEDFMIVIIQFLKKYVSHMLHQKLSVELILLSMKITKTEQKNIQVEPM